MPLSKRFTLYVPRYYFLHCVIYVIGYFNLKLRASEKYLLYISFVSMKILQKFHFLFGRQIFKFSKIKTFKFEFSKFQIFKFSKILIFKFEFSNSQKFKFEFSNF